MTEAIPAYTQKVAAVNGNESHVQTDVAETTVPATPRSATPNTVACAVARTLRSHGVDRLFLMTGGDLALWAALRDEGIEMCLARSEAGSVAMADAYARVTGKVAVVYGQWGPGAAHVAGALADAWWARSPVLALTSTVPTGTEFRNEYQELDQPPMFASVTKWQARINRGDRAAELVAQALTTATSGVPRPVHLDLPSDLVKHDAGPWTTLAPRPTVSRPAPTLMAVSSVLELLRQSERPAILAGNGVVIADAASELIRFAETIQVPVATTMGGKGSIPENHPLALGVAGRYSRKVANEVLADADLLIAFGTDLGGLASDSYAIPAPATTLVQVDLDEEQIGRTSTVHQGIVADAKTTLAMLTDLADAAEPGSLGNQSDWLDQVTQRRNGWQTDFNRIASTHADGHVRPEAVAKILRDVLQPADIVVADTGFMGAWGGALFEIASPGRTFLRAAGTLGWAFPAVLGAQLAAPGRRAVALVGDGGFGYNIGDIETAVRLDIPAIVVVLNNACLAYEHVGYMNNYAGDVVTSVCDFLDIDHAKVAEAFGCRGARVTSAEQFEAALRGAVAHDGPTVIDVVVSKDRYAPVTTFEGLMERDL